MRDEFFENKRRVHDDSKEAKLKTFGRNLTVAMQQHYHIATQRKTQISLKFSNVGELHDALKSNYKYRAVAGRTSTNRLTPSRSPPSTGPEKSPNPLKKVYDTPAVSPIAMKHTEKHDVDYYNIEDPIIEGFVSLFDTTLKLESALFLLYSSPDVYDNIQIKVDGRVLTVTAQTNGQNWLQNNKDVRVFKQPYSNCWATSVWLLLHHLILDNSKLKDSMKPGLVNLLDVLSGTILDSSKWSAIFKDLSEIEYSFNEKRIEIWEKTDEQVKQPEGKSEKHHERKALTEEDSWAPMLLENALNTKITREDKTSPSRVSLYQKTKLSTWKQGTTTAEASKSLKRELLPPKITREDKTSPSRVSLYQKTKLSTWKQGTTTAEASKSLKRELLPPKINAEIKVYSNHLHLILDVYDIEAMRIKMGVEPILANNVTMCSHNRLEYKRIDDWKDMRIFFERADSSKVKLFPERAREEKLLGGLIDTGKHYYAFAYPSERLTIFNTAGGHVLTDEQAEELKFENIYYITYK
jgi:hypothetical protein